MSTTTENFLNEHGLEIYNQNLFTKIAHDINEAKYNDTELKGKIHDNEMAISTLSGEGTGSVKKQIDDALNDFATKVSNDGVINTFKELLDYCATHTSEISELVGDISNNSIAISTLEQLVGELPTGTDATTIIEYINSQIASIDIEAAKQQAISTAASDATTKANKSLSDANIYTDTAFETLNSKIEGLGSSQQYAPISDEKINALFN